MNLFSMAFKLFRRDFRSGELTLLIAALTIAVTSSTAVSLFSDRLQRTMTFQTAEFLAADLVVTSPNPIPSDWLSKAAELQLDRAQTIDFSSVLMENDEFLMVGVKAVSANYPLRGFLKTIVPGSNAEVTAIKGPEAGQVWIEKRILASLKLKLGDFLTIGEKPLLISRILTYEPELQTDFYSFSPRAMMNMDDLTATRILQPGSHVHYYFQFSGTSEHLLAFNRWLKSKINPTQRILDVYDDRPELGSMLERSERYLDLINIIVIVIAGVAIAMATRRYSERHYDVCALLRCLGSQQKDILGLYSLQFFFLALLAGGLGCLAGWLTQQTLIHLLKPILPQRVADPGFTAYTLGAGTGIVVLLGFALPPLIRLRRVSALRMLRRDLSPLPASTILTILSAIGTAGTLFWFFTDDMSATLTTVSVGFAVLLLLALIIYGLLLIADRSLTLLPVTWRYGFRSLIRQKTAATGQIMAFSLTLAAMIVSYTVRNDLITDWKRQMPEQAPNHFALNIFPDQKNSFANELIQQDITASHFFPIIRGRLTAVNDTPVQQRVVKNSQGENATHRELSLTWSTDLPEDNTVVAGSWWDKAGNTAGLVSVEKKLADSLDIHLSDHLTFIVGSQQITAIVANLRDLQWATMKPNFYMIFSPGTLEDFAATYLTSFYLPDANKDHLNALIKKFPATTILEVDLIIRQMNTLLRQLVNAANFMLYFALTSAFLVLWAAVHTSLDNRINEGAVMRSLGASRQFIIKTQFIEFSILGLVSGLLAIIMSEITVFSLYRFSLNLTYTPEYRLWLPVPLLLVFWITLAGGWGARKVLKDSPLKVLRAL